MNFKQFNEAIQKQFLVLCATGKLFRSSVTGQEVWDTYLGAFKPENNPVFRDPESSEHNCNNDKNFIRRYGNIVAINNANGQICTMFDCIEDDVYGDSVQAVTKLLSSAPIKDVFFETFNELNSLPYEKCTKSQEKFQLGTAVTHKMYTQEEADKFGVVEAGKAYQFNHFHVFLPKAFVDTSGTSVEALMGQYRDAKNVFQRAMQEISLDTLELVKDLIVQGSLLNGDTHVFKIDQIIPLKKDYDDLPAKMRDVWCWLNSYKLPFAKFRNELIGTLCVELAEGMELNTACQNWNKRVDPLNYMKATAPITKKQINEAQKFVEENGYEESFNRRFATIEDIDVSEIIHSNSATGEIKTASIFDGVKAAKSTRHKRSQFDGVEEISIDKFMKDVLPRCTSVEAFLENRMEGNMVTLTTANDKNSKPIFKWNNNYSWTYNGNLAGKSEIKQQVKEAGGKVDGVLRFSITWNEDGEDILDFDAHAKEPNKNVIYYGNRRSIRTGGFLDVDMINPRKIGVENITWTDKKRMDEGKYSFFIHNFNSGRNKGFKAEIEFDGEVYTYIHNRQAMGTTAVAEVTLKNGVFTIEHKLPETASSKSLWNLETNEFHKVKLICLSPNHWGTNKTGNKHYFMMLDGCASEGSMRSFHIENLSDELLKHKRVLEILGNTHRLQPSKKQLAGIGINSTVKDEVVLRLKGSHNRVVKVKF